MLVDPGLAQAGDFPIAHELVHLGGLQVEKRPDEGSIDDDSVV